MGKSQDSHHAREVWAVVLVGLALLLLLSLVSYNPYDVGNAATPVGRISNFIGPVGAWIGYLTFSTWGLGAYVLMGVLAVVGVMLLMGREFSWRGKVGAGLLLLVSASVLLHLARLESARASLNLPSAGGFIGLFVGDFFSRLLGRAGTAIIFLVAYLVSLIFLVNFMPSYWVAMAMGGLRDLWERRRAGGKAEVEDDLRRQERDVRQKEVEVGRELARREKEARKLEQTQAEAPVVRGPAPEPKIADRSAGAGSGAKPKPDAVPAATAGAAGTSLMGRLADKLTPKKTVDEQKPAEATPAAASAAPAPAKPRPKFEKPPAPVSSEPLPPYILPPLDLLEQPVAEAQRPQSVVEDLKLNAEILRTTLEEFGIQVQIAEVTKGPAVTLYEMIPAPGLKVEKIAALSNNIALAMKAVAVRILTPVPGKGTVGIEVPNPKCTTVYLRDILESEDWRRFKAHIPVALGRDVQGNPILGDLAEMPHLLVAGATGSGKTVCVNAILATLLFRFSPEELRLVLIDPKVVEMQHFNVLPHLIVPVVTEPKKVPIALRWVMNEMERRYRVFAHVGVRNIAGFNTRPKAAPVKPARPAGPETTAAGAAPEQQPLPIEVPRDDELVVPERVPYIVVVVDELADLMHTVPADIEMGVARLTALGRAAGIHLIVATQRPSVDVVTGVIKANIPTRIAFQVSSKQDSRVILDANGADKLLGKGDMLYLPPGSAKLVRAQGVLVLDDEIRRIVDHIAQRSRPRFEPDIHQKLQKPIGPGGGTDEQDEEDEGLVEQALEVIRQSNRASVSVLQRRLRIGYTRAARIMDLLEERGVVGPSRGAEPREILTDLEAGVPGQP